MEERLVSLIASLFGKQASKVFCIHAYWKVVWLVLLVTCTFFHLDCSFFFFFLSQVSKVYGLKKMALILANGQIERQATGFYESTYTASHQFGAKMYSMSTLPICWVCINVLVWFMDARICEIEISWMICLSCIDAWAIPLVFFSKFFIGCILDYWMCIYLAVLYLLAFSHQFWVDTRSIRYSFNLWHKNYTISFFSPTIFIFMILPSTSWF